MTTPDRIRQALAPAHAQVELTPFAQALAGGRVGQAEYVAGLRQMGYLHEALEAALADAAPRHPGVAALYDPVKMDRAASIARDLGVLGEGPIDAPAAPAARLAAAVAGWAAAKPWALLGALYVVEGSRMGSMVLARSVGKALGRDPRQPGTGLDYHADGLATRPHDWRQFRQALADLPLTEAEAEDVCAAAADTMDGMVELYAALPAAAPAQATLAAV